MKKFLLYSNLIVAVSSLWGYTEPTTYNDSLIFTVFHLDGNLSES